MLSGIGIGRRGGRGQGGADHADDADVVDLLRECHERIRRFTTLAARLVTATDAPLKQVAEAAEQVRRYFAEALPLHARDEDETVAPRLRGRSPALDAVLVKLSRDHDAHGPDVAWLVALCQAIAREPARLRDAADDLSRAAATLQGIFEEHLALEEERLFPAISELIDPPERKRMVIEMRARRA